MSSKAAAKLVKAIQKFREEFKPAEANEAINLTCGRCLATITSHGSVSPDITLTNAIRNAARISAMQESAKAISDLIQSVLDDYEHD